tara:strand:- start:174 stop:497 length:324 start_codon:yes stop_codon:yes gene_type:complete
LTTGTVLISQIEEVPAAVPGEPDCKLIHPYIVQDRVTNEGMVEPYTTYVTPMLVGISNSTEFMISSDKIFTIAEPNSKIENEYKTHLEKRMNTPKNDTGGLMESKES